MRRRGPAELWMLLVMMLPWMVQAQIERSIRPVGDTSRLHFVSRPLATDSNRVTHQPLAKDTDSVPTNTIKVEKERLHNPTTAVVLSAVVPGAGQVYNRQAWKIPIVYAGLGAVSYLVYDNYTQMRAFKEEYLYRVNNNGATRMEGWESHPTSSIYNQYQSYNKSFQLYIFVDLAVYALNLVDAFVFAHLFDFDMNDDISLHVAPTAVPALPVNGNMMVPALNLTLKF